MCGKQTASIDIVHEHKVKELRIMALLYHYIKTLTSGYSSIAWLNIYGSLDGHSFVTKRFENISFQQSQAAIMLSTVFTSSLQIESKSNLTASFHQPNKNLLFINSHDGLKYSHLRLFSLN